MSKTANFLKLSNQEILIKRMYQRHVRDGGQRPISTFREQVPQFMLSWKKTHTFDTYESLIFDPVSEMEAINNEFMDTFWPAFSVGDEYKTLPRLDTPADYHNLDTKAPEDVWVSSSMYRDNNAIPIWQGTKLQRNQDRTHEGNGLTGRSLDQTTSSCGDLDELLKYIDRPYRTVDYLDDEPYYGQSRDEGTTILIGRPN